VLRTAINSINLIKKITYIKYGEGYTDHVDKIKSDMQRFLRSKSEKLITRQTIKYWFDKGSSPKRASALEFLQSFILNDINIDEIDDPNRRRVYDQVKVFLDRQINQININSNQNIDNISTSKGHRLIIDINIDSEQIEKLASSIVGQYDIYHQRLTENINFGIAKEYMEIFTKGRDLNFRIWYRNEEDQISEIRGSIFKIGEIIWFIGHTIEITSRLRVMCFRDFGISNEKYNILKWGILTSDIPLPTNKDPASCKVLIHKIAPDKGDAASIAIDRVGAMDIENLEGQFGDIVKRMINNRITAISKHASIEPVSDIDGDVEDMILKTNQNTLFTAQEIISKITKYDRGD